MDSSRRDGTPFMNLLMIAPLYDNKGTVRYFLGCQIDVSPLIEGGRGMESFEHLLSKDRADSRFGGRQERKPAEVLGELGAMLNEEEMGTVRQSALRITEEPGRRTPPSASRTTRGNRRILGMDEDGPSGRALWPHPSLGPSGRLPGVYQNVRGKTNIQFVTSLTSAIVPSRATIPIASHHVHFSSSSHSRLVTDQVPRARRWPLARS